MERKYRMTNLDGDYYFLSNDGSTLCRVGRYIEDGSAEGVTGRRWCSFVFNGPFSEANEFMDSRPEDFLYRYSEKSYGEPMWREVSFMERTRAEAIDSALKFASNEVAVMQEP